MKEGERQFWTQEDFVRHHLEVGGFIDKDAQTVLPPREILVSEKNGIGVSGQFGGVVFFPVEDKPYREGILTVRGGLGDQHEINILNITDIDPFV